MTLYEYILDDYAHTYNIKEYTVWDKDYDMESYFYGDMLEPDTVWDRAMQDIAHTVEVVETAKLDNGRTAIVTNFSQVIGNSIEAINKAELFTFDVDIDDVMDRIMPILSGNVSERWMSDFSQCLRWGRVL